MTAAVCLAFASARIFASTPASTLAGTNKTVEPAIQTQLVKASPAAASATSSPNKDHAFQVKDEKGLLLTCIAPQIDTDPDTDIFQDCSLAPGRTLDDVMHTFIQAIHVVQNQQAKERAEWYKDLEERSVQKPTQK